MPRALPPNASVVTPQTGGKLHAPAAARNAEALTELLRAHAPSVGVALEIASGTGQHVMAFGRALPDLHWHPTEVDIARCHSIDAYVAEAGLKNVEPAALLDATQVGWGAQAYSKDLVLLINLLHLIPTPDAKTLITEAAAALAPQGTLIFYGPFKREGLLTSEGDARFDADLRAADSQIGYKDTLDIAAWLGDAGLDQVDKVDMPANNLAFIAKKARP